MKFHFPNVRGENSKKSYVTCHHPVMGVPVPGMYKTSVNHGDFNYHSLNLGGGGFSPQYSPSTNSQVTPRVSNLQTRKARRAERSPETFELRFFVDCGALSFCWCLRGGYGLPTRPQWEPTRAQVVGNLPTRPTRAWFC